MLPDKQPAVLAPQIQDNLGQHGNPSSAARRCKPNLGAIAAASATGYMAADLATSLHPKSSHCEICGARNLKKQWSPAQFQVQVRGLRAVGP